MKISRYEWRLKNSDKIKEYDKEYRKNNPDKSKIYYYENKGCNYDHIIPMSCAKTEEDVIRLNHYTNLQPLCSHINRNIKKAKVEKKVTFLDL